MEYKEFVEYIKMNAGYIAGEGGNITINHVIKNNGCVVQKMSNTGTVCMNRGILEIPFIRSRLNLIKNFFVHNKILHVKSVVNEKPCLHGGALA